LPNKKRDNLLDFYKGIAITIVVLGHTCQYLFYPITFANELGYRFIGAMQMPFFVFLSGATAAIWIGAYDLRSSIGEVVSYFFGRIKASAFRLLSPFFAWTLIGFLIDHRSEKGATEFWLAFQSHFLMVFHDPMYSLWFLLCIFYCIFGWCLIQILLAALIKILKPIGLLRDILNTRNQVWIQVIFSFFMWIIFRKINPRIFGTWFVDDYFFYFILGVVFHTAFQVNKNQFDRLARNLFSIKVSWLPYSVFALLAPLWSLTADDNLDPYSFVFHGKAYVNLLYRFTVAVAGIYVALDISRSLYFLKRSRINDCIAYIGKMSLGIYALHTYFLNVFPPVIGPLVISVIIAFAILQIPLLRGPLLGERRKG
jgi:fucose 4-O-acetylase-like acetyltransferase